MQNPKMIVLGLLAQGKKYGLEMERFIDETRMRLWAQIGASTIYKILRDLQKDGAVASRRGRAQRGPGRTEYTLTSKGKEDFARYVAKALTSGESCYSDRIAGLVFALALPPAEARKNIRTSMAGLEKALADLQKEKAARPNQPVAQVVLEFYETVYGAERTAMEKALNMVSN